MLSGVNRGSNVAEDITHSGTIAAAMEATLCGVTAIAMSQGFSMWDPKAKVNWQVAERYGADLIHQLVSQTIPPNILLNLNFPDLPEGEEVAGIRLCPMGRRVTGKQLDERFDAKGRPYYWVSWMGKGSDEFPNSDIASLSENFITITPLNLDLTDYKVMEQLREHIE